MRTGKIVAKKIFQTSTSCCTKKCFLNIASADQEELFNQFWELADYCSQNVFLSSLLKNKNIKNEKQITKWTYYFRKEFSAVDEKLVCEKFLLQVIGIKRGRMRIVQEKIKYGLALSDQRGKSDNHFNKLTDELKKLIHEHCESLPHSKSHYTNSTLNYFKNSNLTFNQLYKKFINFYKLKTGKNDIPFSESVYFKYFNRFENFTLGVPQTDSCDVCYENEQNEKNNLEILTHKENVTEYTKLKSFMLSTHEDYLCLEFNFGQNLPLPKLSVSAQFYMRLIWLHVFNVHVHGNKDKNSQSYMFFLWRDSLRKEETLSSILSYMSFWKNLKKMLQ